MYPSRFYRTIRLIGPTLCAEVWPSTQDWERQGISGMCRHHGDVIVRASWHPRSPVSPSRKCVARVFSVFFFSTSRQRAKSTAGTERIGHGGATNQTANLCSKLNFASLPRPQGPPCAPVPATESGEPLGTDAEPGPSLSDGVRGPSHPPGGCSVTRPPNCCVTRPRAWSRTSILNRFASLLAGGLTKNDIASFVGWSQSPISLGFLIV